MKVNVSAVQSFVNCPFRWWAEYVMNRVPVATAPALDAGRIYHKAHERHATTSLSLAASLEAECWQFREAIPQSHPAAHANAYKAVETMEDLIPAMPLWRDKFPITKVLEVEQAYEYPDPIVRDLTWLVRPDRVVISGGRMWHTQRRGLAASKNFAKYVRLQNRSYHEHLYAEAMVQKYSDYGFVPKWGGTVFDLVRKLKFHTNVGKKNEKKKTAEEMFWQGALSIKLSGPIHGSVMHTLRQHVGNMRRALYAWEKFGEVPAPNDQRNGGYGDNSEDAYFKVLIGETTLDDNDVFKTREDPYAHPESAE